MPASILPSTPFTGRNAEMALLESLISTAQEGEGTVVLVSGEPGIGKSRLVRELVGRVRAQGAEAAVGTADEDSADGFDLVVDLLRSAARRISGEALKRLAAAQETLVERSSKAVDFEPSSPLRREMFESVAEALGSAARGAPPLRLLVLEDMHWADTSSLGLIAHLARRAKDHPQVLLCTFRPERSRNSALAAFVDRVRQEQLGPRLTLHPLDDEDAATVVRSLSEKELAADEIELIVRRGDGNPLFIEELVRALPLQRRGDATQAVPDAIRDLVQRRSAAFPAMVRSVAGAASMLGDNSRPAALSELAGGSLEEVGLAIDELVGAGIVDYDGRVHFRHALIRDAIYDAIPLAERHRWHLATANLLERDLGVRAAALIAFHLQMAGDDDKLRRAFDWRLIACRRSLDVMAFEDSVAQLDQADRLIEQIGGRLNQQVACSLLRGEASRQMGLLDEALVRFSDAATLAAELKDAVSEAHAALGYELAYLATGRPRSEPGAQSLHLLDRALVGLANESDSEPLRARLLAASAQARFFAGYPTEADDLSAAALASARRSGDRRAEAAALEARRVTTWRPENLEERRTLTNAIVELGEAAGDPELLLDGLYWRSACELEAGETGPAGTSIAQFARLARESHQPRRAAESSRMRGMMALLAGDLPEARRLAEESLVESERAESADARIHYTAQMVEILRDTAELAPFVEQVVRDSHELLASPTRRALLSSLYARLGDVSEAAKLAESLASDRFEALPRDWMWLPLMFLISETIELVGNGRWAEMAYEQLAPFAGRLVVNSNTVCYGSVELALGKLAVTAGWPVASDHLARAAERNEAAGARLWAARAREALQGCRMDAGSIAGPSRGERSRLPSGITSREAEVLRLIAAGLTNQQIADQLVLSARTVERHITNLYTKIGARGRADATAFALRHSLDS